jgi:hypothetical protein
MFKIAKEKLIEFYQIILRQYNGENTYYLGNGVSSDSPVKNGFGSSWLGNYLVLFNVLDTSIVRCGYTGIGHRGSITYIQEVEEFDEYFDSFYIQQEDAWSPNILLWDIIISRNYTYNGVKLFNIFYSAEECGMQFYAKNDVYGLYYPVRFYVDYYLRERKEKFPNYDCSYYHSAYLEDEEIVEYIKNNITGTIEGYNDNLELYTGYIQETIEKYNPDPVKCFIPCDDKGRYLEHPPHSSNQEYFELNKYEITDIKDVDSIGRIYPFKRIGENKPLPMFIPKDKHPYYYW